MKLLDIFFKKEKEKTEEAEEVPEPKETLPSKQLEASEGRIFCDNCGLEIFIHEKRSKLGGKIYHRKCLKRLKKAAKKMAFG